MAERTVKVLVVNSSNDPFVTFEDKYQIFTEWNAAIAAAKEMGWEDPFGTGINKKPGIANGFQCGSTDVMIIGLIEQ